MGANLLANGFRVLIHHVQVCRGQPVEIELMSFECWLVLQVEKACLLGRT